MFGWITYKLLLSDWAVSVKRFSSTESIPQSLAQVGYIGVELLYKVIHHCDWIAAAHIIFVLDDIKVKGTVFVNRIMWTSRSYTPAQINSVQVFLVHTVRIFFTFAHRWKEDVTRFKSIPTLLSYDVPSLRNYARNTLVHQNTAPFLGAERRTCRKALNYPRLLLVCVFSVILHPSWG